MDEEEQRIMRRRERKIDQMKLPKTIQWKKKKKRKKRRMEGKRARNRERKREKQRERQR